MTASSVSCCKVVFLEGDRIVRALREDLSTVRTVEWFSTQEISTKIQEFPSGVICLGSGTWREVDEEILELIGRTSTWGVVVVAQNQDTEILEEVPVSDLVEVVVSNDSKCALRAIQRQYEIVCKKRNLEEALRRKSRDVDILHQIGKALGSEHDPNRLFDLILTHARRITGADAGSIYILRVRTPDGVLSEYDNEGERFLYFAHTQSDTLDLPHRGANIEINRDSMAGYVALTGEVLNLPDAYSISSEVPYRLDTSFDRAVGYRTKSMLCLPMRDAEEQIIGVLQLINKKLHPNTTLRPIDRIETEVIPFSKEDEEIGLAVAGQAAVALENGLLYESIERLFEGFVRASVQAIEARDPVTSGHSERVAQLTLSLAEAASAMKAGPLRDVSFSTEELRELRYAGLLHDFGKVGVREQVLTKPARLYPREWENVVQRFNSAKLSRLYLDSKRRLGIIETEGFELYRERETEYDAELEQQLHQMDQLLESLEQINKAGFLSDESKGLLDRIANQTYENAEGETRSLIEPQELSHLSVPKGTLNADERREMESHVSQSFVFLRTIPWTRSLRGVPRIAGAHHEKLDGSGYPHHFPAEEIPVQSRMMTIADIFDALTSSDRPYKPAMGVEEALDVLRKEAESGHLDQDLVDLFIQAKVYKKVIPGMAK